MRLVVAVVAGDQPRQHAGIRRVHLPADHGQAHARHWAHAEALQHRDVAMPAPTSTRSLTTGVWLLCTILAFCWGV